MNRTVQAGILLLIVMFTAISAYGQKEMLYQRMHMSECRVMLVQLKAERRKIEYYTKKGDGKSLADVKQVTARAMKAMVDDFEKSFKFCKVYYFVDTNFEKVMRHEYGGVLLNADMKPAENIILSPSDTDYYFVYFGIPQREKLRSNDEEMNRGRYGTGLVVMDHNYVQTKSPFPFFTSRLGYFIFSQGSVVHSKYEIEYYNYAGMLSRDLGSFFGSGYIGRPVDK